MIDSYDNYQLELFKEAKGGMPWGPRGSRFFNFLHRYEKRILIAIGVAVSCIIAFSWGVKRGKEVSSIKNEPRFDLAINPVRNRLPKATVGHLQRGISNGVNPAVRNNPVDTQGYTIQLASYKAKKFADTQAGRLKKKGLAPFVLKKGDYIILCVGRFSGKDEARNQLSKFKKDYKDCYLRRL